MYIASRVVFLASVLAVNVKTCESAVENGNNVIENPMKPHVVKHDVTGDSTVVKLKCNVLKNSFRKNRILSINELRWEHKKCGYGLHLTTCANFPAIPWTPVMCKNGTKFCDGYTLKLENPKTTDSGYYRCLYKNYMSKDFKIYKIFHLDVYDPQASFEILEESVQYDNHVVPVNGTVTFRCRARSLFPLHMIWAKLVPDGRRVNRPIQYGANTYELISNDGCYYIGNDLYISKLTLNGCQAPDSGVYNCIVISLNDAKLMKNKTVTLNVVPGVLNSGYSLQSTSGIQLLLVWVFLLTNAFS